MTAISFASLDRRRLIVRLLLHTGVGGVHGQQRESVSRTEFASTEREASSLAGQKGKQCRQFSSANSGT